MRDDNRRFRLTVESNGRVKLLGAQLLIFVKIARVLKNGRADRERAFEKEKVVFRVISERA
jgi:hypothetical protein